MSIDASPSGELTVPISNDSHADASHGDANHAGTSHADRCRADEGGHDVSGRPALPNLSVRDYYGLDPAGDETVLDVASDFQEATKLFPGLGHFIGGPATQFWDPSHVPLENEGLPTRRLHSRAVPLPAVEPLAMELSTVVTSRRSLSPPGDAGVTAVELSTLLATAYGACPAPGDPRGYWRPVPSGGAMYPLDLYVGVGDHCEVPSGVYHYDPFSHVLEQCVDESGWRELTERGASPSVQQHSSVALLVAACFPRQCGKYGMRGYRLAYLEAGHVGQNAVLAATALGLRSLPYASFYDAAVEGLLGLDGVNESLVHAVLLGRL